MAVTRMAIHHTAMDQTSSTLVRGVASRSSGEVSPRGPMPDQHDRRAALVREAGPTGDQDKPANIPDERPQSVEEAKPLVEQMNEIAHMLNKHYEFSIDEETDQLVVKVTDSQSGEVLYQIPPEELLKLTARLGKMMGMFLDEVA